jgi:multicomponent Na+:H+ antiporter subunit C
MELFLSMIIAVLIGVGVYLVLQSNLIRVLLGVLMISNAANLIVWLSGSIKSKFSPIIKGDGIVLSGSENDPLPQALILTAIVIGFAVVAFLLVLLRSAYSEFKSMEWDDYTNEKGEAK